MSTQNRQKSNDVDLYTCIKVTAKFVIIPNYNVYKQHSQNLQYEIVLSLAIFTPIIYSNRESKILLITAVIFVVQGKGVSSKRVA